MDFKTFMRTKGKYLVAMNAIESFTMSLMVIYFLSIFVRLIDSDTIAIRETACHISMMIGSYLIMKKGIITIKIKTVSIIALFEYVFIVILYIGMYDIAIVYLAAVSGIHVNTRAVFENRVRITNTETEDIRLHFGNMTNFYNDFAHVFGAIAGLFISFKGSEPWLVYLIFSLVLDIGFVGRVVLIKLNILKY